MSNKHRIVFDLTEAQFAQFNERVKACNMKVNAYAKQLALDETDCIKLKRGAVSTMAKLYYFAEQTTDLTAREYLRKAGDLLCQSLK